MMSRIPNYYRPPLGIPLYWRDEISGKLSQAVFTYVDFSAKTGHEPSPDELSLLIEYFQYYINAPCWAGGEDLEELRQQATGLKTSADISEWIEKCLSIGLDPI